MRLPSCKQAHSPSLAIVLCHDVSLRIAHIAHSEVKAVSRCLALRAEAFYVWLEDRPMPPWQYALAGLMALVIFALCLFPLAPAWLRSVVVYFFLGLLGSIFALILIRFLLFLVVFAFVGALC